MKLTKTQKNFRKQMQKLNVENNPLSYKEHNRNVIFTEYDEPKRKNHPILNTIIISILIYIIKFIITHIK